MNTLTTEKPSEKPLIRRYSNLLTYFKDYYAYRKTLDEKFNYDIWSAELGFKSRSFMYLIASGKRLLTLKVLEHIASHLNFSLAEKKHLILLSSYHRAKSNDLKSMLFDKILENTDTNENTLEAKNYFQFVSSPSMPLIKLLLSFDDFKGSVSEISQALNLTESKVKKDLGHLEKMGLIRKFSVESSPEIFWKAESKTFVVPDDRSNNIMEHFYNATLLESMEVNKQPDIFKRFRTILFAIPPEQHETLLEEIEKFLSKMKNRFGYNNVADKHLLKLNLQAYPATKTIGKWHKGTS